MKQCDLWVRSFLLHEKFIRCTCLLTWEIYTKKEWKYCILESSIKGRKLKIIYLPSFLSSPFFHWAKFSPIMFNYFAVLGGHYPVPLASIWKTNLCPFMLSKPRNDKRYQRIQMPLVSEGKNSLASKEMVVHSNCWGMEYYNRGTRRQASQESIKKYIVPTHAVEICKRKQ